MLASHHVGAPGSCFAMMNWGIATCTGHQGCPSILAQSTHSACVGTDVIRGWLLPISRLSLLSDNLRCRWQLHWVSFVDEQWKRAPGSMPCSGTKCCPPDRPHHQLLPAGGGHRGHAGLLSFEWPRGEEECQGGAVLPAWLSSGQTGGSSLG